VRVPDGFGFGGFGSFVPLQQWAGVLCCSQHQRVLVLEPEGSGWFWVLRGQGMHLETGARPLGLGCV
jgi:hypothetical protein